MLSVQSGALKEIAEGSGMAHHSTLNHTILEKADVVVGVWARQRKERITIDMVVSARSCVMMRKRLSAPRTA